MFNHTLKEQLKREAAIHRRESKHTYRPWSESSQGGKKQRLVIHWMKVQGYTMSKVSARTYVNYLVLLHVPVNLCFQKYQKRLMDTGNMKQFSWGIYQKLILSPPVLGWPVVWWLLLLIHPNCWTSPSYPRPPGSIYVESTLKGSRHHFPGPLFWWLMEEWEGNIFTCLMGGKTDQGTVPLQFLFWVLQLCHLDCIYWGRLKMCLSLEVSWGDIVSVKYVEVLK